MKVRIPVNPFSIFFVLIFGLLIVYNFGWSELCPPLTLGMWLFFLVLLVSLFFLSKIYDRNFSIEKFDDKKFSVSKGLWSGIGLMAMLAEFVYERTIPLITILFLDSDYNYVDFEGIPVFHVFAVTFTSFWGLYLWDSFIKTKKWTDLALSLLFVSYPIMLFNRGGLILNFCSMFFIFLLRIKEIKLSFKLVAQFIIVVSFLLYAFGLFGNIRSAHLEPIGNDPTNSTYIMNTGQATEEFKQSIVPKPFFWTYIYMATPIANLQNMIEKMRPTNDIQLFVTENIVPDFLGKRLSKAIPREVPEDEQVHSAFNVSTLFAPAYKLQGYIGIVLVFLCYVGLIFFYTTLMKNMHTTKIVGLSILYTITIFNLFSNMMVFSGLSLQLIYPIIFWIYKKIE